MSFDGINAVDQINTGRLPTETRETANAAPVAPALPNTQRHAGTQANAPADTTHLSTDARSKTSPQTERDASDPLATSVAAWAHGPSSQAATHPPAAASDAPATSHGPVAATQAVSSPRDSSSTGHVSAPGASAPSDAARPATTPQNAPLDKHDQKTADFLTRYIQTNGAKGLPDSIGESIVRTAQAHHMDPLLLAAIPGLETQWGRTGVGVKGMAGVGAYDNDPNNSVRNPVFSGLEKQINGAATAFENLRHRFGSNESKPILQQLRAANGHGRGYSTSTQWAGRVYGVYRNLLRASHQEGL